jgi:hypothetical protein
VTSIQICISSRDCRAEKKISASISKNNWVCGLKSYTRLNILPNWTHKISHSRTCPYFDSSREVWIDGSIYFILWYCAWLHFTFHVTQKH